MHQYKASIYSTRTKVGDDNAQPSFNISMFYISSTCQGTTLNH